MSSSLLININIVVDQYVITATIASGGNLPANVFIYENVFTPPSGTGLGKFLGTCNVDELTRLKTYDGSYIPVFGNKYLKYSQAKIVVSSFPDVEHAIQGLTSNVTKLSLELQTIGSSSRIISIP